MIDTLLSFMKTVFSSYFAMLTVICGIFLSVIYPYLFISDSEYKTEYKIGKYIGYLYIFGSLFFFIITKLFG